MKSSTVSSLLVLYMLLTLCSCATAPWNTWKAGLQAELKAGASTAEQAFPWEKLAEIGVPTIILNGSDDEWAPVDVARRAASLTSTRPEARFIPTRSAG